MPSITRVDFVPIPTEDVERGTAFYRDTLGLAESEHTVDKPSSEFDLGGTTLSVWDPSTAGREFQANTNPVALHTDDVHAMREQLEGRAWRSSATRWTPACAIWRSSATRTATR